MPGQREKADKRHQVELRATFSWRFLIRLKSAVTIAPQRPCIFDAVRCSGNFVNCFWLESENSKPRNDGFAYDSKMLTRYLNNTPSSLQLLRARWNYAHEHVRRSKMLLHRRSRWIWKLRGISQQILRIYPLFNFPRERITNL